MIIVGVLSKYIHVPGNYLFFADNWQLNKSMEIMDPTIFNWCLYVKLCAYTLRSELSQLVLISWYIYRVSWRICVRFSLGRAIHTRYFGARWSLSASYHFERRKFHAFFKWENTVYIKTEAENTSKSLDC